MHNVNAGMEFVRCQFQAPSHLARIMNPQRIRFDECSFYNADSVLEISPDIRSYIEICNCRIYQQALPLKRAAGVIFDLGWNDGEVHIENCYAEGSEKEFDCFRTKTIFCLPQNSLLLNCTFCKISACVKTFGTVEGCRFERCYKIIQSDKHCIIKDCVFESCPSEELISHKKKNNLTLASLLSGNLSLKRCKFFGKCGQIWREANGTLNLDQCEFSCISCEGPLLEYSLFRDSNDSYIQNCLFQDIEISNTRKCMIDVQAIKNNGNHRVYLKHCRFERCKSSSGLINTTSYYYGLFDRKIYAAVAIVENSPTVFEDQEEPVFSKMNFCNTSELAQY